MRVAVAEDGGLFRDGLMLLLQASGHEVVGAVASGTELLELLDGSAADVAILDIRMPPEPNGGLSTARILRSRKPELGLLLLSHHAETHFLTELLSIDTERIGYRLKDKITSIASLSDTLARIAAGELVLEPSLVGRLVDRSIRAAPNELSRLSPREVEVLRLMAEGRSNAGIAGEVYVSVKSVEKYVAAIFTKLGLTAESSAQHRRVLAVLAYLRASRDAS